MNWNDLQFFVTVARSGSLSAAASELATTPTRVSRHIDALERTLSMVLFHRSPNGYRLTDEGLALVPAAEAVEHAALGVQGAAAVRCGTKGRVRLATAEAIARFLIAPHLPSFNQQYPNIELDLHVGSRVVDLARTRSDLALRLTRPGGGNVTVRRLARMACANYRSAEAVRTPEPTALKTVSWTEDMADLPAAVVAAKDGDEPLIRANALSVQHEIAAAGLGRTILPCFVGDRDGRLVRDGDVIDAAGQDMWLVIDTSLTGSGRVRAVADLLSEIVSVHRDLIEGRQS